MMIEILLVGLLGTVFGSFLNVLILRLREGVTILGRSECPGCRVPLKARHLVPVLSWILLRGRCAFCGRSIHVQYPVVEFLAGCLFVLAYIRHPWFLDVVLLPAFAVESVLLLGLLSLVVFDFRWKLLPIEPMVLLAVLAGTWNIFSGELPWTSVVLGVMIASLFLGVQVVVSKGRWLGEGDPWLAAFMGAWLGWPGVGIALYLTYVVGGLIVALLWLFGVVRRGTRIPFAPLLAGGTLVALVYGDVLRGWMERFLGI